jgi:radical SAM enzyme (TIGR01210 family)
MRHLRQARPVASAEEYGWYVEQTRYRGRPYELPLAWFVTNGCTRDRAGSCTMCNFGCGNGLDNSTLLWQVDQIMKKVSGLPMVYITPLGSMFDDAEVPPDTRMAIFHHLAQDGVRVYGTESRPETITDEKMQEFRNAFDPHVVLQVGLGVETANPYIQLNCINKGLLEEDSINAIQILKRHNIVALVHVLLKPLFLTESEAIEDSINTINWAFEHGADGVIFCMTNIKPYTLTHWLQQRNGYRVPYVWSGLKVLQSIKPEYRKLCTLSGLYSGVTIHQTAFNCPRCTNAIIAGMQRFSTRPDPAILDELEQYACNCRAEWRSAIEDRAVHLPERLPNYYERIALEMFGDEWWSVERESVFLDLDRSRVLWDRSVNSAR